MSKSLRYFTLFLSGLISVFFLTTNAWEFNKKTPVNFLTNYNSKYTAKPEKPHFNQSQQINKPYVVLVSIDGYRYDYTEKYNPPNLTKISQLGVAANGLRPSFPSSTFPNHYTIVTGLYPDHHGIVANSFYDPKRRATYSMNDNLVVRDGSWYGGVPLWRVAEMNGMLSATMYWVGSEADIAGGKASYVHPWIPQLPHEERVNKVIEWLSLPEEQRPHLITLYFSAVDSAGHSDGPESNGVGNAVLDIDQAIGKLHDWIQHSSLNINLIIVSDHGMHPLDNKRINLADSVDLSGYIVNERGPMVSLHAKNTKSVNQLNETLKKLNQISNVKAYLRQQIPKRFHYGENEKVGDILVTSAPPYYMTTNSNMTANDSLAIKKGSGGGTHGWDNEMMTMNGIFYAEGQMFKKNLKISTFENIHIYPLVLKILDLNTQQQVDGSLSVLENILN